MLGFSDARTAARQIAAVGEQTRLMILYTLVEGPRNVGELADALNVSIVNMSHHLNILRHYRLIQDVKNGRYVVYKVNPDVFTPSIGDAGGIGTLSLGICRLAMRRPVGLTAEGGRVGKKAARRKGD
jgi:ArsR family transcriptional regulator